MRDFLYISVLLALKNAPFGMILRNNHYICTRKGLFTLYYTLIVPERDKTKSI